MSVDEFVVRGGLVYDGTGAPPAQADVWVRDGEIMAVKHMEYPVYGVQFHPESIMTPQGRTILKNFLSL